VEWLCRDDGDVNVEHPDLDNLTDIWLFGKPSCAFGLGFRPCFIGSVFVTREHVRHNKSGIAHRGRTGINH
jgi:hypothetical protein